MRSDEHIVWRLSNIYEQGDGQSDSDRAVGIRTLLDYGGILLFCCHILLTVIFLISDRPSRLCRCLWISDVQPSPSLTPVHNILSLAVSRGGETLLSGIDFGFRSDLWDA
ncbi:Hypothetical predicted protein [Mytilus galloprovincialis]|uniref:Uncharacterized protein n=1 Tax=Mytilus galloprovincialis TaxID=29158 RepID=A0A8B6GJA4_MYTGA|nr:Hypothetical predicted protein [Mytilus galloprovincialis]